MGMGARPLPVVRWSSHTTTTGRGKQNGRDALIRRLRNAGQRGVQPRNQDAAVVVHKRSPPGLRLSRGACTYLLRAEIRSLCGRLLQRSHPGAVRRIGPTRWSIASSIALTTTEKPTVQLVSADKGSSGRSVTTHPPMNTNSRFASSRVSSSDLEMASAMGGLHTCNNLAYGAPSRIGPIGIRYARPAARRYGINRDTATSCFFNRSALAIWHWALAVKPLLKSRWLDPDGLSKAGLPVQQVGGLMNCGAHKAQI